MCESSSCPDWRIVGLILLILIDFRTNPVHWPYPKWVTQERSNERRRRIPTTANRVLHNRVWQVLDHFSLHTSFCVSGCPIVYLFFWFQCLLHSWYLAADTQLFLLCLFVMTCIWKWPRSAIPLLSAIILVSIGIPMLQTYSLQLDPTMLVLPR